MSESIPIVIESDDDYGDNDDKLTEEDEIA